MPSVTHVPPSSRAKACFVPKIHVPFWPCLLRGSSPHCRARAAARPLPDRLQIKHIHACVAMHCCRSGMYVDVEIMAPYFDGTLIPLQSRSPLCNAFSPAPVIKSRRTLRGPSNQVPPTSCIVPSDQLPSFLFIIRKALPS